MRSLGELLPTIGSGTKESSRKGYGRLLLVAILLLTIYLLVLWAPLEGSGGIGLMELGVLALWCLGGLLTLGFLALAGRKSS
ncbi:hypothetical protein [Parahaliea aestuarii]|uniref:Uncharacterized protein n=1 Tax=Parahaliea aestuarii TaxID=1852021 RepID=A0A5C8ZMC3_9GAMM|nr:hypothetical protein [Parahaliea aestuarii]TXS89623.1 hypothetical protein FVW59_16530 [Parahaliea aestuarii]